MKLEFYLESKSKKASGGGAEIPIEQTTFVGSISIIENQATPVIFKPQWSQTTKQISTDWNTRLSETLPFILNLNDDSV